jgi:hypothetical protein
VASDLWQSLESEEGELIRRKRASDLDSEGNVEWIEEPLEWVGRPLSEAETETEGGPWSMTATQRLNARGKAKTLKMRAADIGTQDETTDMHGETVETQRWVYENPPPGGRRRALAAARQYATERGNGERMTAICQRAKRVRLDARTREDFRTRRKTNRPPSAWSLTSWQSECLEAGRYQLGLPSNHD